MFNFITTNLPNTSDTLSEQYGQDWSEWAHSQGFKTHEYEIFTALKDQSKTLLVGQFNYSNLTTSEKAFQIEVMAAVEIAIEDSGNVPTFLREIDLPYEGKVVSFKMSFDDGNLLILNSKGEAIFTDTSLTNEAMESYEPQLQLLYITHPNEDMLFNATKVLMALDAITTETRKIFES